MLKHRAAGILRECFFRHKLSTRSSVLNWELPDYCISFRRKSQPRGFHSVSRRLSRQFHNRTHSPSLEPSRECWAARWKLLKCSAHESSRVKWRRKPWYARHCVLIDPRPKLRRASLERKLQLNYFIGEYGLQPTEGFCCDSIQAWIT